MIVPGFQDSHIHPLFGARNLLELNLDHTYGREAYLEAIARLRGRAPRPGLDHGRRMAIGAFPGGTPTKEDLDAAVPDRPVFLMNTDVHGAWVNTKALERGGITAATPDPWDGRIERDADGEPMGTLTEGAAYTFREQVVPGTPPKAGGRAWSSRSARCTRWASRDGRTRGSSPICCGPTATPPTPGR